MSFGLRLLTPPSSYDDDTSPSEWGGRTYPNTRLKIVSTCLVW
jgi:hypothetical protein